MKANPTIFQPSAFRILAALVVCGLMAIGATNAATTLYWAPGNNLGANGTWSTSSAVWSENSDGSSPPALQAWPSSGTFNADFNGGHTVTLDGTVQVNQIRNAGGNTTINNGTAGVIELIGDGNLWGFGNILTINVPVQSNVGLRKIGNQQVLLTQNNPNLQGTVLVNQGPLAVSGTDNMFPAISSFEFGTVGNASMAVNSGTTLTVPGILSSAPDPTVPTNHRVITASGSAGTIILDSSSATPMAFYGRFGNAGTGTGLNVTKRGSYTQIIAGSEAQSTSTTFTNSVTLRVEEGILAFAKTEGANAWSSAGDIEIAGGVLRFDGNDQLPGGIDFEFEGGVMDLNNFRNTDGDGDGSGNLVQFGTINLQGDAAIDFGSLAQGRIWFADSSAEDWDEGATLTINNFVFGTSVLRFGTDADALSAAQKQQVLINGSPVLLDSMGFAVIPEPSTAALLLGAGLGAWLLRRRRG